ncbi:uncharacterized protein LOC129776126 [Toxorhynchites rutilus septentrionalis]|uniref:uncharacterized protein LOC129776126 n=1 Tax=Toxorhynchites rutilus septentrionalis TaxID=329112 RepID=UPI00247A286E|nr:uncharacterized protein LOC129776126 [Toxorhynchites rutilus septentrionalis]XP_055637533.1 uncharacterized protein LOC129776126 [Toxorhynchites rutilus septentrionalis]XP_055637534.1 uncharacterized protein LOC129776126 [Toxorhynchites rutilus septentrionalis]
MLAIDCLVGGLLLSSIGVNILALGAFWVTPSLRTTANRFVINLLIVNLVCCIILGPSLLLNAFTSQSSVSPSAAVVLATDTAPTSTATAASTSGNGSVTAVEHLFASLKNATAGEDSATQNVNNNTDRIVKCRNAPTIECDTILIRSNVNIESVLQAKSRRDDVIDSKLTLTKIRCWGLDLVVALGALSVLLVVGDTWCAVTDPLRYHSRISELKAWAFIATTWLLGIAFGIASGFRGDQKNITLFNNRLTSAEAAAAFEASHLSRNLTTSQRDNGLINHLNISEDLYNTIFSYTYFVIVILLPFGLVCGMYWRIFSEARESGQRMRQNGSSPLLQSALNLVSVSAQKQAAKQVELLRQQTDRDGCDGLTMKIDKQIHYEDETITVNSIEHSSSIKHQDSCLKPLLQQSPSPTPVHQPKHHEDGNSATVQIENNITLGPLATPPSKPKTSLKQQDTNLSIMQAPFASTLLQKQGKIRRNHSAGRLVSFSEQNQELRPGLRQVHSTPNFQKFAAPEFDHIGNHHILSLPAVHVPPKALRYMTSIRHRLSNASSLFKYREESRAARISILVIIMFLVSYLPYGILVLMQGHVDLFLVSDQALLAIFTVVIANLSSPFIFAYRNKRVRRGVRRLLGIDKKTNERLQKLTCSNTNFNNNNHYNANISFHNAAANGTDGGATNGQIAAHKSHKVRIAGLSRSGSSSKYLTPNHAAAMAVANGYMVEFERYPSDELNSLCIQKKSILKRVCDSSRKWGCNFATNSCTSNDEQTEV